MYEKQGYLHSEYRIFEIKDYVSTDFLPHYHDFSKLIVFLNGSVVYNIEGKNYDLKPGDIVLVPANQIHKPIVSDSEEYERIVVYLSDTFLKEASILSDCFERAKMEHINVLRLSAGDFSKLVDKLRASLKKSLAGDYGSELYSKLYLSEGLLLINESIHNNGFLYDGNVSYDRKIIEVCEYINDNISDELSVSELSKKFFISKYYFMRQFKEYTGVTVHNYILEKRLLYTKRLAENGEKITVACLQAGFKDYSTYLKAKKRLNNVSLSKNGEILE